MAIRIVGVDLPQNKRGEIALTYIYGIGRSSSAKILDKAGVNRDLKVSEWSDDQAAKIREIIGAEFKVEGDLRSEIQMNIKRLMDIGLADVENEGVVAREYFGERRGHARLVLAGDVYLDDFDVVLHRVAFFLFFFSVNS